MSGRGRGRGRGAPPSGAKLLLMRSAQESGLDDRNLKSLNDITRPELFPDLEWAYQDDNSAASKTKQASSVYLINKGREIDHRIQSSSHWVRPSQTQVDVVRYHSNKKSHRYSHQLAADMTVLEQMGKNLATDESYIPSDLLPTSNANLRKRSFGMGNTEAEEAARKKPALDELEKKELEGRMEESRRTNVLQEEEATGSLSDNEEAEEEQEEMEDYTTNYYESEDESDGGGDAEATF